MAVQKEHPEATQAPERERATDEVAAVAAQDDGKPSAVQLGKDGIRETEGEFLEPGRIQNAGLAIAAGIVWRRLDPAGGLGPEPRPKTCRLEHLAHALDSSRPEAQDGRSMNEDETWHRTSGSSS